MFLRKYRGVCIILSDFIAASIAYILAFLLRFDFAVPVHQVELLVATYPLVLAIRMATFGYFRLHEGMWRYASISDLLSILKAVAVSQVLIVAAVLFFKHGYFPRSVLIIDGVLAAFFISTIRFSLRVFREFHPFVKKPMKLTRLLIYGAGDLGENVVRKLEQLDPPQYNIFGFMDDNPAKWNSKIHGYPIFGGKEQFAKVVDSRRIDEVLVAVSYSRGKLIKELMDISAYISGKKIVFKTVPTIEEMLGARRPVTSRDIELSDLMPRKQVNLDMEAITHILADKTVLVTGAGGTIGQELCRQIAKFHPKRLLMLEKHNTALFYIDKELKEVNPGCDVVSIAGNVRDKNLLSNIFEAYSPEIVFHAAAHKHVPLMESNPQEAVKNNTLATLGLAEIALKYKAERFLYISTDKAVRPSSVMGVSKRLGEMVVRAMSGQGDTKFMSVRFGNVLGSSGSVVKIFQEQINAGGPITVTHPDVTRYFMTTAEAIQLILQACSMGQGGEIFVLNMGMPVKVLDIAKNLIALNGLNPDRDIEIKYIGLRPGEKLFEELFRAGDVRKDTGHADIFMAVSEEADMTLLRDQMSRLAELSELAQPEPIIAKIRELVPAYTGNPTVGAANRR